MMMTTTTMTMMMMQRTSYDRLQAQWLIHSPHSIFIYIIFVLQHSDGVFAFKEFFFWLG